jgi:hypothetical protein
VPLTKSQLIALSALALFLLLALARLSYPGLYFDELHFVNAALGDLDGSFVEKKLFGIPIFLVPYIGALKAWLYAPIFYVFPVNAWSVRLPMILLGALGLWFFFRLVERIAGLRAAGMAIFLLVLNPAFVWAVRVDFGPVAIEFFLQVLGTWLFFTGAGPVALGAVFLLGLFNRVTFAWWMGGFCLAGLISFPKEKRRILLALLPAALFALVWAMLFPRDAGSAFGAFSLREHWHVAGDSIGGLIDGSMFYRHALGEPFVDSFLSILWAGAFIFCLLRMRKDAKAHRHAVFFLGQMGFTLVAILLTPRAISYWHFFHLLPWLILLLAWGLSKNGRGGAVVFALLLLQQAVAQIYYLKKTNEIPMKAAWSPAIYELMDYCRQDNRTCASVEWGTHTQILGAVRDAKRAWPFYLRPELAPGTSYIMYAYDRQPGAREFRENFLRKVREAKATLKLERTIDQDGRPIFELYQLEPRPFGNKDK